MSTRTATGSGVKKNNGTVALGVTTNAGVNVTGLSLENAAYSGAKILNSVGYPTKDNGLSSAFKTDAVTITSVADNSGTCRFTLNSHGLSVGDILFITGSTDGNLDGTHEITAKATNTFDTNVTYVASATPGDYQKVARNFGKVVPGEYLIKLQSTKVAGTTDANAKAITTYGGSVRTLKYAKGNRRYDITSWNAVTGAATYGSNRGDKFTYRDASGTTLAHEAYPTNAVPGGLVYHFGAADPYNDSYPARTSP